MSSPIPSEPNVVEAPLDNGHFHALRELSRDATLSQRDLAGRLGLSLGRVNFIVNSLIRMGLVKARRFKNSRNKLAYRYILTPEGMREKIRVTRRFLHEKLREYERLQREIEELRNEAVINALAQPAPSDTEALETVRPGPSLLDDGEAGPGGKAS